MKLEVGMHVRTKHYGILKILKIIKENPKILFLKKAGYTVVMADKNNSIEEEIIGKPSYNIIDLIEVGDYVNGRLVCRNDKEDYLYLIGFDADGSYYEDSLKDIKSIVTKEQFKSRAYEVQ